MSVSLEKQKPAIDLSQFYGTEAYYRYPLTQSVFYTDGVKYFAEQAGAYWFLDIVFSEYEPLMRREGFITVNLSVYDGQADITVTDGDDKTLANKHIHLTDCPSGEYLFFFTNDVFMVSSEY
ncbi:MAG: hypothetical protein EBT15_11550 [Betaproteobacteria bacterium]|nr:hypothetical protein [Betaproteobacteria bacterium]